jgi:hypothetical protein
LYYALYFCIDLKFSLTKIQEANLILQGDSERKQKLKLTKKSTFHWDIIWLILLRQPLTIGIHPTRLSTRLQQSSKNSIGIFASFLYLNK